MSGANATVANALPRDQQNAEQRSHEPSMEEILASIRRIISDDQMLPLSPRASVPPLPPATSEEAAEVRVPSPPAKGEPDHGEPDAETDHHTAAEHDDVLDLADVGHDVPVVELDKGAHDDEPILEPSRRAHPPAIKPAAAHSQTAHAYAAQERAPPMTAVEDDPPVPPKDKPIEVPPPRAHGAGPSAAAEHQGEPQHEPLLSENTVSSVSSSFHQLAATMLMQNFPPVDQIARELLRPMIKTWLDDNLPVMVERLVRAEIERVARGSR